MKRFSSRSKAAFTLLEIMLVVMIIALLAGSAIYLMRGNVDDTKFVRAEIDVQNILNQLQLYSVQNGNYPSTEQGIFALVEKPSGEPQPRKWRALLEKVPIDPWGVPYQIRNPATKSKSGIDLFSAGPDRQPNTADDVGNWES
jgi:general secretion pathway protein G